MKLSQLLPGMGEELMFYGAALIIALLSGFVLGECHASGHNLNPAIAADTTAAGLYKRDALRAHSERDSLATVNRVLEARHAKDSTRSDSLHAVALRLRAGFTIANRNVPRDTLPAGGARDTGSRPAVDSASRSVDTVAFVYVTRESDGRRFTVPRFIFEYVQAITADDSAKTAEAAGEHALAINYAEQLQSAKLELASIDSANAANVRAVAQLEKQGHSAFGVKTGIVVGLVAAAAVPKAPQALGHLGTQLWQLITRGKP